MARRYTPAFPFNVAAELLIPTYTSVKGVLKAAFPLKGIRINCAFRTYGGTERNTNDVFAIIDTATVETWYRPDIKADCAIRILETGKVYEIISAPEDIEMRHQFVVFKVQAVEGTPSYVEPTEEADDA